MHTHLGCLPCLLQQALNASQRVTPDLERQREVLEAVALQLPRLDPTASPVDNGDIVHRVVRLTLSCDDPFRAIKQASNRMCLDVLPHYRRSVKKSTDPLLASLRQAAAANAIDVGPGFGHEYDVASTLDEILEGRFDFDDYPVFREQLSGVGEVLYLADNAGEIAFDRLVIEQLSALGKRVTFVVRGGPILNDATIEDARIAGIDELAEVIANGQRGPGTSLNLADTQFANRVRNAGLILSKGQGNYEGLSGESLQIYFLFRVKCRVVAQDVRAPMGTILLRSGIGSKQRNQRRTPDHASHPERRNWHEETHSAVPSAGRVSSELEGCRLKGTS